jgi:predicted oxidoreductase
MAAIDIVAAAAAATATATTVIVAAPRNATNLGGQIFWLE